MGNHAAHPRAFSEVSSEMQQANHEFGMGFRAVVVLCGADADPAEIRREGFAELFRLRIRMEILATVLIVGDGSSVQVDR